MHETVTEAYFLADLTRIANKMTYERARAEAMGFHFTRIEVRPMAGILGNGALMLRAVFTCVCGRQETFTSTFPEDTPTGYLIEHADVARELRRAGSFSRDHLLSDGYTPEQIDEIERKGEDFDEQCRQALSRPGDDSRYFNLDDFRRVR